MNNDLFIAHDTCGNTYTFDQSKKDRGILLTMKKEKLVGFIGFGEVNTPIERLNLNTIRRWRSSAHWMPIS